MSDIENEARRVANTIGGTTTDPRVAQRVAEISGNQFSHKPEEPARPSPSSDLGGSGSVWELGLLAIAAPILYVLATVSQRTLDTIVNVALIGLPLLVLGGCYLLWRK